MDIWHTIHHLSHYISCVACWAYASLIVCFHQSDAFFGWPVNFLGGAVESECIRWVEFPDPISVWALISSPKLFCSPHNVLDTLTQGRFCPLPGRVWRHRCCCQLLQWIEGGGERGTLPLWVIMPWLFWGQNFAVAYADYLHYVDFERNTWASRVGLLLRN